MLTCTDEIYIVQSSSASQDVANYYNLVTRLLFQTLQDPMHKLAKKKGKKKIKAESEGGKKAETTDDQ